MFHYTFNLTGIQKLDTCSCLRQFWFHENIWLFPFQCYYWFIGNLKREKKYFCTDLIQEILLYDLSNNPPYFCGEEGNWYLDLMVQDRYWKSSSQTMFKYKSNVGLKNYAI